MSMCTFSTFQVILASGRQRPGCVTYCMFRKPARTRTCAHTHTHTHVDPTTLFNSLVPTHVNASNHQRRPQKPTGHNNTLKTLRLKVPLTTSKLIKWGRLCQNRLLVQSCLDTTKKKNRPYCPDYPWLALKTS